MNEDLQIGAGLLLSGLLIIFACGMAVGRWSLIIANRKAMDTRKPQTPNSDPHPGKPLVSDELFNGPWTKPETRIVR